MKKLDVWIALACLVTALAGATAGSSARAQDTVTSVLAELQTRLQSESPIFAECDILCTYRNETWRMRSRSFLQHRNDSVAFGMTEEAPDALSVLFPSQIFLAIGASLDPLSLSRSLSHSSPRLLPSAKLDGVEYRVLELDYLPTQNHPGAIYPLPEISHTTVQIYLSEGRIKRIIAQVQRAHAPREPGTQLIAEVDVRYRRPKTGVERAPGAPLVSRIVLQDNGQVPVSGIAWSPDGKEIACLSCDAGMDKFDLYSVASGKEAANFPVAQAGTRPVQQICFAADGRSLVTFDPQTGTLLSVSALTGQKRSPVPFGAELDALLSADAARALVWDSRFQSRPSVRDGSTGQKLFDLPPIYTQDVQFSMNGKFLALLLGNRVVIKDAATGRELHSFRSRCEQGRDFPPSQSWRMAFSPDSRLIAIGDARSGRSLYDLMHDDYAPALIYVYEIETGRLVQTLTGTNGAVTAIGFSPDGSILAVGDADDRGEVPGENAAVLLWETNHWKSLGATAVQRQSAIAQMQFAPDGKTLATLAESSHSVEIWSVPHP